MIKTKTRVEPNPVADCLRAARRRLKNPKRWFQGERNYRPGKNCAYTAISGQSQFHAMRLLIKVMEVSSASSIIRWNDAPERTHAEVLAAFDKAIELAERRQKGECDV